MNMTEKKLLKDLFCGNYKKPKFPTFLWALIQKYHSKINEQHFVYKNNTLFLN